MFGTVSNRNLGLKVEKNARARKPLLQAAITCGRHFKSSKLCSSIVVQEYASNMSRKKVKEDKMKADLFAIWNLSFKSGLDI